MSNLTRKSDAVLQAIAAAGTPLTSWHLRDLEEFETAAHLAKYLHAMKSEGLLSAESGPNPRPKVPGWQPTCLHYSLTPAGRAALEAPAPVQQETAPVPTQTPAPAPVPKSAPKPKPKPTKAPEPQATPTRTLAEVAERHIRPSAEAAPLDPVLASIHEIAPPHSVAVCDLVRLRALASCDWMPMDVRCWLSDLSDRLESCDAR